MPRRTFTPRPPTPAEQQAGFEQAVKLAALIRDKAITQECEDDLGMFLEQAWHVLEPGFAFSHNWHIDGLCEHLEALARREIKRLIINIPPRSYKSGLISVTFPAWRWISAPEEKFVSVSYSKGLTLRDSRKTRALMGSAWYQTRWGDRFKLVKDQNEKGRFENDNGGYRLAASIEGGILGEGASCLIMDDPNDLEQMSYPDYRQSVKDWYSNSCASRFIDPKTDVRICVQQRSSYGDDLTSFLLELGGWEHWSIPNEWEGDRRATSIGWSDPRTHLGELMHPDRLGPAETATLKVEMRANYCTPGYTPILMADWTEKSIEDIKVGDMVIGYSREHQNKKGKKFSKMHLVPSEVKEVTRIPKVKVYRYRTESGREFVCTEDHKWWRRRNGDGTDRYLPAFMGTLMHSVYDPPEDITPCEQRIYDWLGGMIDGEGTCVGRNPIAISQSAKNPEVQKELERVLPMLGFDYKVWRGARSRGERTGVNPTNPKWSEAGIYVINGGRSAKIRILANCWLIKDERIRKSLWLSAGEFTDRPKCRGKREKPNRVMEISPFGEVPVYGLTTTTGNYVAWGFASQNSGQYQQNPTSVGGGGLKQEWFNFYNPKGTTKMDLEGKPITVKIRVGQTVVEKQPVELPEAFEQIVQSWDCLDEQTQILAIDGWKGKGEVGINDLVYSLNTSTQKLEIVPVLEYKERAVFVNEQFVRMDSHRINVRVTEGHDLYVGLKSGQAQKVTWKKVQAGELVKRPCKYRLLLAAEFEYPGVKLTNDELRFIAWFVTDGGWANQYVQISQTKDYKNDIRDLLVRLGFDFVEKIIPPSSVGFATTKSSHRFMIPKGTKTGIMARKGWIGLAAWLNKDICAGLHDMTRQQFLVFWSELMKGNGDLSNGYLCMAHKTAADQLQQMAVTRGLASSMHSRPSPHGTEIWYVSVRERPWIESNPKVPTATKLGFDAPRAGESVWCVQNINATLVTRRGGRVSIQGNCAFKDAESNDYVAGHTWGRIGANSYLLSRDRDHRNFPDTLKAVRKMSSEFPCPEKLVEDAANGPAVISMLKNEIPGLIPVTPAGGKFARVSAISGYVEAGNIYLPNPELFPWVWDLLKEFGDLRSAKHDDDTDAMSQALRRLYDSMSNQGVPEFRVQPRLGEPQSACHVGREKLDQKARKYVSVIPNGAVLWLAELPSGSLRIIGEREIKALDARTAGEKVAEEILGDVLNGVEIELYLPKLAFAPIEPHGSWAELMEEGMINWTPLEGDFDLRERTKDALKQGKFRLEMIEEEDASLDRLRLLLAFAPPDFKKVPYDRKRALEIARESLESWENYMAACEGQVRGEWPKLKISPDCPRLIAEMGGFRRDKLEEAPDFVRALLQGVSVPGKFKSGEPREGPVPSAQKPKVQFLGRSGRLGRKFGVGRF